MIASSGLTDMHISIKKYNVDIMDNCNDSLYQSVRKHLPAGKILSDYIVSVDFTAYKKG